MKGGDVKDAGMSTVSDETVARIALRALVDAYAHHVDGADAGAVAALFSDDGSFVAHFHTGAQGLLLQWCAGAGLRSRPRCAPAWLCTAGDDPRGGGVQVVELDGAQANGRKRCAWPTTSTSAPVSAASS